MMLLFLTICQIILLSISIGLPGYGMISIVCWIPAFLLSTLIQNNRRYFAVLIFAVVTAENIGLFWVTDAISLAYESTLIAKLLIYNITFLIQSLDVLLTLYILRCLNFFKDLTFWRALSAGMICWMMTLILPHPVGESLSAALGEHKLCFSFVRCFGTASLSFLMMFSNLVIYSAGTYLVSGNYRRSITQAASMILIISSVLFVDKLMLNSSHKKFKKISTALISIHGLSGNTNDDPLKLSQDWLLKLKKYILLTKGMKNEGMDLVIWPEGAYRGFITPYLKNQLHELVKKINIPIIFGAYELNQDSAYLNALNLYTTEKEHDRYRSESYYKRILIPLVEDSYNPLSSVLKRDVKSDSHFAKTKPSASSMSLLTSAGNLILKPEICYEILFSGSVADVDNKDLIINIANDRWLNYSHFKHALTRSLVLRSIENGIPVVRVSEESNNILVSPVGVFQELPRQNDFSLNLAEIELRKITTGYNFFGYKKIYCFVLISAMGVIICELILRTRCKINFSLFKLTTKLSNI